MKYLSDFNKQLVKEAISAMETGVLGRLNQSSFFRKHYSPSVSLSFLVFKEEQKLEVYFNLQGSWRIFKSYELTAYCGKLGPKLKEGDQQIPEGIYLIEHLNPKSKYHLSMKLNYPNAFDLKYNSGKAINALGSDIFIHGKDITTGCVAIGDDAIEELFYLAFQSFDQEIKVIICPRDFRVVKNYPIHPELNWTFELYTLLDQELQWYNNINEI